MNRDDKANPEKNNATVIRPAGKIIIKNSSMDDHTRMTPWTSELKQHEQEKSETNSRTQSEIFESKSSVCEMSTSALPSANSTNGNSVADGVTENPTASGTCTPEDADASQ